MKKQFPIFIIATLLYSCFGNTSTFDKNERIGKLGTPGKIEYYEHLQGKAFEYSGTATFVITDRQELTTAINEIKKADHPELWKGAGWDRIKIYYADTILNINTDKLKIGIAASGTFYTLTQENFIIKQLNKK